MLSKRCRDSRRLADVSCSFVITNVHEVKKLKTTLISISLLVMLLPVTVYGLEMLTGKVLHIYGPVPGFSSETILVTLQDSEFNNHHHFIGVGFRSSPSADILSRQTMMNILVKAVGSDIELVFHIDNEAIPYVAHIEIGTFPY